MAEMTAISDVAYGSRGWENGSEQFDTNRRPTTVRDGGRIGMALDNNCWIDTPHNGYVAKIVPIPSEVLTQSPNRVLEQRNFCRR